MNLGVSNIQSRSLNCCNCGAALAPANVVCPHCLSRNAVDLMAIKQFRLLDKQADEACPNGCGSLTLVALDDLNCVVRHCTHCKGLFLGLGTLQAILQRVGREVFEVNQVRLENIRKFLLPGTEVRHRSCPACKKLMLLQPGLEKCPVVIDRCERHGTWLDSGELTVLAEWLEAGGQLLTQLEKQQAATQRASEVVERAVGPEKVPMSTYFKGYLLVSLIFLACKWPR